jgi:hypothetical protein
MTNKRGHQSRNSGDLVLSMEELSELRQRFDVEEELERTRILDAK